jgi:MFS family permease
MSLSADARLVIAGQAIRAIGYGCTAVLLGALLAGRNYSPLRAGLLLGVTVAGTAGAALVVGAIADRIGRRRCLLTLYLGLAVAGALVVLWSSYRVLLVVAATGLLSTDVVDNGPATTLEQAVLAGEDSTTAGKSGARVYGVYNMVASLSGALGALLAAVPSAMGATSTATWPFLVLVLVGITGAIVASRLSPAVEGETKPKTRGKLTVSRRKVRGLAALFAVDAGGGGLVTASFLAYYLTQRYDAATSLLGVLFFTTSLLQAGSVWVAPRLADRIGLVPTMVATHLPSNVLLASVAFAPTLPIAIGLLLARTSLSQMDVPTRQALVMQTVTPAERVPAAALTNAARYTVRPIGPLAGGLLQQISLGLPLLVAGVVKGTYDVALWSWFTRSRSGS